MSEKVKAGGSGSHVDIITKVAFAEAGTGPFTGSAPRLYASGMGSSRHRDGGVLCVSVDESAACGLRLL
jgi:hypothetical protein